MKLFFLGMFLFVFVNLVAQPFTTPIQSKPSSASLITFRVIILPNGTFGYDIFKGDHRFIHQTSKPCMPGNQGFRRKEDAEKVAKLVVEKLTKNILPPSVTISEMDSLKINY